MILVVGYANPRTGTTYRDRVSDASRAFGRAGRSLPTVVRFSRSQAQKRITKRAKYLAAAGKNQNESNHRVNPIIDHYKENEEL
jgi:hypothetical protein